MLVKMLLQESFSAKVVKTYNYAKLLPQITCLHLHLPTHPVNGYLVRYIQCLPSPLFKQGILFPNMVMYTVQQMAMCANGKWRNLFLQIALASKVTIKYSRLNYDKIASIEKQTNKNMQLNIKSNDVQPTCICFSE